jgi:anti-anti-sigma regulatory factor
VVYRISRSQGPDGTVFDLSGEMDRGHAERLEELLAAENGRPIVFDLEEVTLVGREAVRFLAGAEARGIRIVNCPDYVRSSIAAERGVLRPEDRSHDRAG